MSSLLIRGFVLGLAVAAAPGPIFFLCLRRTLVRGWLFGLVSGLGVATADGFYAAVAVFGITAITSLLTGERKALALAGGALLIVLGVRIALEKPKDLATPVANGRHLAWAYLSTLGLTITNPATILSFAALAATLGAGAGGGYLRPAFVVFAVLLGSAAWWCLLAGATTGLRARITPRVIRGMGTLSGLAIAGLGLVAAISALAG
ncbi:MAG: LysE family translocator [Chloroflexi bacterium]|nr:MAG: LysE family translocator [Chloroflexota bacterium]